MDNHDYKTVRNLPVAKFYYKGSHSRPVRRTVLVITSTSNLLTGYELREGSTIRKFKDAPVKTYSRKKIAKEYQLRSRKRQPASEVSTLRRSNLFDLIESGV